MVDKALHALTDESCTSANTVYCFSTRPMLTYNHMDAALMSGAEGPEAAIWGVHVATNQQSAPQADST